MASGIFTATQQISRPFAREELLAIGSEAYFSFDFASGAIEASEDFARKLELVLGEHTSPREILARIDPQDKSTAEALFSEVQCAARSAGEAHLRIVDLKGEPRWLRLRVAKASGAAPDTRLIASFSNIDAEKRRDAEVELSTRRQDDLLRQIEVMRAQLSYVLEVVESQRVWVWDLESGAAGLLQGLAHLLGLNQRTELASIEALQGRVHAEDWPSVRDGLRRLWQEEAQPVSIDYRVRSAGDIWQWVRTRGGLWRRGEISGVVCAGTHSIVTGEREARARRDRESALFTAFLESAPAAVAMFDKDMRYIYASQRWCKDFDLDARNLIGRSHYDVFPEIGEDWKAVHRRCLAGSTESSDVDRFARASGQIQYLRWIVRPWHMSDGSIGGIIMLTEEITDRQRRAVEIAEDQERLRAALAIADAAVWEYDITSRRFYASERLAELAGCESADAKWARGFVETLHPDHADAFRAEARKFWSGATDRFAVDLRVRHADGGYRWLRSYVSAVEKRGGKPSRIIGFLKDIGSLKEAELAARNAEERANAASAAKSRFLATMSHEIRTPLNGVLGMASALEAAGLTQDQRAMLGIIQSSGEDLLALLNDLLDMSKVESGTIELNEASLYLPQLVERVAALFTDSARAKRTALNVRIAPSATLHLWGDAMRIRQILNNLISNAVKFTDEGEITISVERIPLSGEAQTIIKVADTGIGIAADQIDKVFEPFVQVDPTLSRRYEGTGLGLAICRRLAERMRGTITASSEPGKGSVFIVALPLAEAKPAASARIQPRSETPETGIEPLRVLVAEDNRKNQIVIEKVLAAAGAKIVFAADGEEAVARWSESEVDLVLMDVRMPVADGLWASREIRQREKAAGRARTPIIALSADATAEGVLEALAAGMDAHIAKPIQVRPLLETIASIVRSNTD